jgi:hypothetical protein
MASQTQVRDFTTVKINSKENNMKKEYLMLMKGINKLTKL